MSDRTPTPARARRGRHRLAISATAALAATTVWVAAAPSYAEPTAAVVVFDDMEHGDPLANGWFSFVGAGGGGIAPNSSDLPPIDGGSASLETGWGGPAGFLGGFGRGNPTDLTGTDHFNLWINPDDGQEYTLEINFQEDDNSDGAISAPDDDEFQFNCVVGTAGPCATAGGGWQLISIPLADFVDDNSFLTGGNGELDAAPVSDGGNGELINVVIAVIGTGTDVTFRTDYWVFSDGPLSPQTSILVDDFESGVAPGGACPAGGLPLGFCTFNDVNSSVTIATTATVPAAMPGAATPNQVLQMDADVVSFAGFIHGFTNAAMDAWVPQDWSTSEGISFWMYGSNSGTSMFIDVLDNRTPGSTNDDAERWSVAFTDDFTGWQLLEFPFSSFARKEVGNGAPNDGFGLFQVHGYAIGTVTTQAPLTVFVDDVRLYGVGEPAPVAIQLSQQNTFVTEGTTGEVGVKLTRPLGPDDPAQVSIDYATERSNAVPGEEFTPTSGTLTFVNGGPSELSFPVETFDDTKFEGDEQIVIRLTNPVDVERGTLFQGSVLIDDDDPFDPDLLDDFEQGAFLWDDRGDATIEAVRVEAGSPDARPGQDAFEQVGVAHTPVAIDVRVLGSTCPTGKGLVPVHVLSSAVFDATTIDHTTVTIGGAAEAHVDRRTGEPRRHVDDVNGDGLDDLVFHVRFAETGLSCGAEVWPVTGDTFDGRPVSNVGGFDAALTRDFPLAQDWSDTERLDFWYHGAGGGEEITVTLKDNRAPDPGPDEWELVWADEFDDPAGTTPNPANWAFEIGDTTPDGKNGWGNEELQYYTDDPANAATDGDGNLVIRLTEADGSQECYYGPCEFESARLITQHRAEFAYGRIESRLLVPDGGDGLWPAFWSLGTDITYNPWPGAGEIDIMEYVSRIPNEIFGTVHGPGYSGGASIGDTYDFGLPVYEAGDGGFHTFTVEWEPDLITWYVDGIEYHRVTPADLPGPWVFDKPFFLLLNFAIGGNFGGAVDALNEYPQQYLVDYVHVYQGPDTAERFEASFVDDAVGWRRVSIPMTDFVRSDDQPTGAPDDGLGLDEVWGYGFELPNGTASGEARFDLVERVPVPPPTELVVTTLADGGPGSLREALGLIADGGTITFDPALAGGNLALTAGPLVVGRSVTVDGGDAPGITVDGGGVDRVLVVDAGAVVTVSDLTLRNGFGFQVAGCVLNNGTLTLDHATVTGCTMTTDAGDFWQGGGGIYNGDGATLNLIDSTVSDNRAGWSGGGVYSFFNSTTNVVRSTISGNVSSDVGGGLRLLGNADIVNSTISGNASTGWYGGALFLTDGVADVVNTTITANTSPAYAPAAVFVGTFGDAPATLNLRSSIIAANASPGCFLAPFGGGPVAINSLGSNVFGDGTCFPAAGDLQVSDADLGPLADNGGPTLTHALLPASPAIDVAIAGVCPTTDQRGVARPQGEACDAGAFELVP